MFPYPQRIPAMNPNVEQALTCPLDQLAPLHPDLLKCPYGMNRRLHQEAPVFRDPLSGIYFVSRYNDVVAMAMDHETFSSVMPGAGTGSVSSDDPEIAAIAATGYPNVSTMLTQDPPLQRRYRKFVDGAFSPANLRRLEPVIERLSNDLIDRFIDAGKCEFLSAFGIPLPLTIIAGQLGAPISDLPLLRKWTDAFIGNLSQQLDREGRIEAARNIVEFQHYFVGKMNERRRHPEGDVLSMIVNASIDGEKPLDDAECLSMISQILVAGNETTSAALTEGMWLLIRHPEQYEQVRRNPSDEMISALVEEILRISSPSANMFRRTTRDVTIAGVTIPANSVCFARFAAANQDDARFADALTFDITRDNLRDHVAFGRGAHHCLGAALSRREMNGAFKVIFRRIANFRLAPGAAEPEFAANALLHGLNGLHLAFDRID
jgi:cytochrome P450